MEVMIKPDWQSEDHGIKLFYGDCLKILPEIRDESVDCIFTDPPYGHNNNNGDLISQRERALGKTTVEPECRPIPNDGLEANEIFKNSLTRWKRILKVGCCCCCCCCCGGGPDPQFARWALWMDEVFNFKQMVVWDKGPIGMGWHYRRSYETILVAQKKGAACRWYDETMKIENIIRPGYQGIKKIIPKKDQHPTEKPWQLSAHFIKLHTTENDVVFDPFMGCASTGIACVRTGRRFIGVEISEDFFEKAIQKIQTELQQMIIPL